jgi:hypothetical protein
MEQERFVNETGARRLNPACASSDSQDGCALRSRIDPANPKQPENIRRHRPGHMLPARLAVLLTLAALPLSLAAQGAAADPAPVALSNALQPALSQVNQAVSGIDIRHWKAPGSVKSAVAGDVSSIQRDLSGTLAGLMSQAEAAPSSIPSSFAVYRNVDALYDTLLRVVETANLAAPDQDATALESALTQLESARTDLGEKIQVATQAQQSEIVRLRTVIARAAAAPAPPVKTVVVDDGPAKKETPVHHHTTRKPAAKTAPKPADSSEKPSPQ